MHDRALEPKDQFLRVSVIFVLLDCVADCLFGQAVLQLEGDNWQAVDEKADVQGELGFIGTEVELPGDRKPVLGEQVDALGVAFRWSTKEQIYVVRSVLNAFSEHVNDTALGDLSLDSGKRLYACWVSGVQVEMLSEIRLSFTQEVAELYEVKRERC